MLSDVERERCLALIEAHLEGRLTGETGEELRDALLASRTARQLFWKLGGQDVLLHEIEAEALGAAGHGGRPEGAEPGRTRGGRIISFPTIRRVMLGAIAACIGVAVIVVFVWLAPRSGSPAIALVNVPPGLTIERNNAPVVPDGGALLPGDILQTAVDAPAAVIAYRDGTRLEVNGGSRLRYEAGDSGNDGGSGSKELFLEAGELTAAVAKQARPMIVRTNQAEVRVLGTKFTVSTVGNVTRLAVEEGSVGFRRLGEQRAIVVREGETASTEEPKPADWRKDLPLDAPDDSEMLLLTVGTTPPRADEVEPGTRIVPGKIHSHHGDRYVAPRADEVVVARWGFASWSASFRFELDQPVQPGTYVFMARWMQGGDPKVCKQKFEVWAGSEEATLELRNTYHLGYATGWVPQWAGGPGLVLKPGDRLIEVRNSGPGDEAKVFQGFLLSLQSDAH
jgi:hypothetical protein